MKYLKNYNDTQSDSRETNREWRILIIKVDVYGKVNISTLCKGIKELDIVLVIQSKYHATNSIMVLI